MTQMPPHLSKSRYLAALQCERRLWLGWHEPRPSALPPEGSVLAIGHEVGAHAHSLFPGGVLVGGGPRDFARALAETRLLLGDPAITAIFEPAFEFDGVWVRVDILERAPDGRWIINEVKSSTRVKPENINDLAIQRYVVEGCGLSVEATHLIHVDTSYVRAEGEIDWTSYFRKVDVSAKAEHALAEAPERVRAFHGVLASAAAPERRPSSHCFSPFECEFWEDCTKHKPIDWVWRLPRLSAAQFSALEALGIESIKAIPDAFPLSSEQRRTVEAFRVDRLVIQPTLSSQLGAPAVPRAYLDFETFSPAIPLYAGTRPYQRIAAQWSLHVEDAHGQLTHREFLADLTRDPRRAFCESLLAAIDSEGPILVYSSFEASTLGELAQLFPDLAGQIEALRARLLDVLPLVRANLDDPRFGGSNSIKAVGPVLAPQLSYDDLEGVAEGGGAANALYRLATGRLEPGETEAGLRQHLLRYCGRDTQVLAGVWNALVDLAATAIPSSLVGAE